MPKRKTSRKRTSTRGKSTRSTTPQSGERLQKILAAAGIASRRDCEVMITEGRVMVDGQIITKLGSRANAVTQEIAVDGQILKRPKHVYYAVHKPKGVLSTNWDPSGRMRLVDLAPDDKRLFCVGRLDRSSEGLAMLTNDGELAHRIMHPSFGVAKTYVVEVAGKVTSKDLDDLLKGVYLSEGRAKTSNVRVKSRRSKSTLLEIELQEGKNREIRRIMAKLDHKVLNLKRVAIGPLRLGDMPAGAYRDLTSKELAGLRKASEEDTKPTRGKKPPRTPSAKTKGSAAAEAVDYDDDFADSEYEGLGVIEEMVEVREHAPNPGGRGGAVIGGEPEPRSKRKTAKKKARGGKGASRGGPSAKRGSPGRGSKKKVTRGKPKRKGKR